MNQYRKDEFVKHSPTSTNYHSVNLQEIDSVFYVYIMASGRHGMLDVSVTQNIVERVLDQKRDLHRRDFTSVHKIHDLVHVEEFDDMNEAISRHGELSHEHPRDLFVLIEQSNPDWSDLYGKYMS